MFSVKGRYDLALSHADIDEILEGVIRVAKQRDTIGNKIQFAWVLPLCLTT